MASDQDFVDFIVDQLSSANHVTYRKMFGEYALYVDNKVVALICNNQVFVKPTESGRAYIGKVLEAPAYKGAKPSFLIEDKIEDREWFSELIRITTIALPKPKPKSKKIRNKKIL